MNGIPLKHYLSDCTQKELAESVNLTQGAISKMLNQSRDIFIETNESGVAVGWYEIKRSKKEQ